MKLLIKFKQFFLGMLCMALIATLTLQVFASSGSKTIEVFYNNIKLYVDDNLVTPKDGNGKVVEPFVYNGTTYLPVRAISEALEKPVVWDGKTSSIYIGKHNDNQPDLIIESNTSFFNEGASRTTAQFIPFSPAAHKDINQKQYSNGLIISGQGGSHDSPNTVTNNVWREYILNSQYKKLQCTASVLYDYRTNKDTNMNFRIYGDDNLLYSSPEIGSGILPVDIDIDLTGVNKLKIAVLFNDTTYSASCYVESKLGLFNLYLYQ